MIKTKNLVILVVVLIILFGVSWIQKSSHNKSTGGSNMTTVLEGTIVKDELSRITIAYGLEGDVVEMASTPTGWVVESAWNAVANEQRIDTLLRNLADLTGEFRSDSEAVVDDYGLGGDTSVRIRAFGAGGAEVMALDIGNSPERLPGNFIKSPDASSVYLTQASVLTHLGLYDGPARPQSSHFLELQAVKEDRQEVDRIVLVSADGELNLAKEFALNQPAEDDTTGAEPTIDRLTWEWKSTQPRTQALAKTKADGVMGALVNIRAVDVDDPSADLSTYGLDNPTRSATLVFQDGRQLVLEYGDSREAVGDAPAGTWMRVQGDPTVWVVTGYAVDNAFKKLDELLPEE